jgi:hypothetical protein
MAISNASGLSAFVGLRAEAVEARSSGAQECRLLALNRRRCFAKVRFAPQPDLPQLWLLDPERTFVVARADYRRTTLVAS